MIKVKNSIEFDELIKEGKVLVDFFATWCGPCRMIAPILEDISESRDDVTIIKVDVDELPDIARRFKILSIPTLILFENGKDVAKTMGYQDEDSLNKFIDN